MASDRPSRWVTPDNYSSIPAVISWFIDTTCLLCVFVKFATKVAMKRKLGKDDIAIAISLVFSIGMVAGVSFAAVNGVGRHQDTLSPGQIVNLQKSVYASNLLYTLTLFFSKASVLFLLRALTPVPRHVMLIWIATGVLVAWMLSTLLATAFQCPVPDTWTILSNQCVNQTAFWTYSGVMNLITEICLAGIPLIMFRRVKMRLSTKVVINLIFTIRFVMIGPIIAEIYFRNMLVSSDATFGLWTITVCMLITQGLSIILACAPFLKPFFAALETGMVRLDDTRRLSATTLVSESGAKSDKPLMGRAGKKSKHPGLIPNDISDWTDSGTDSSKDKTDGEVLQDGNAQSLPATATFEFGLEEGQQQGLLDRPPLLKPIRPLSEMSSLWRTSAAS